MSFLYGDKGLRSSITACRECIMALFVVRFWHMIRPRNGDVRFNMQVQTILNIKSRLIDFYIKLLDV